MEFVIPLPSTLLILVLSFLLFLYMLLRSRTRNGSSIPIPGPTKLPIIGNLHNIAGDSRPPHQVFRDLAAKYGPLMHLQLGEIPFVIVSSAEVVKQLLQTHDITFANRPPGLVAMPISYNYTNIGMAPYGEYWRHLRRICTLELLSARRVKSFQHLRQVETLNLSKWIASNVGSPTNLSERVHLSSFDIVARASVGSTPDERGSILAAIEQVAKIGSSLSIADLYPSVKIFPLITGLKFKIEKAFRRFDSVLENIINQHRVNNNEDDATEYLIDVLLKYQEDGVELPLTNDNIKAVLIDMFVAGGETSGNIVEWSMSEMMKNPTALKRAQEEVRKVFDDKGFVDEAEFDKLEYLKQVIKETMRLHPPLPLLVPRYNNERCEINGYEIPAKTTVLINVWALGRDPKYWNEPEKFIPERFTGNSSRSIDYKGNSMEFIPFGAGRRICPGMSFGMASVEFSLCMMLYHFDWELPVGIKHEGLDMTEDAGMTLKRKNHLLLIPTLRRPLAAT